MKRDAGFVEIDGNHVLLRGEMLRNGLMRGMCYRTVSGRAFLACLGNECEYVTPAFKADHSFNDLVASWNAYTPSGTECEVFGRLYIKQFDGVEGPDRIVFDGWTDWISWGKWSPFIRRACPRCTDTHPVPSEPGMIGWAYANSYDGAGDSSINTRSHIPADAFQLKVVMRRRADAKEDPELSLLAATWKNTEIDHWDTLCDYPEKRVEEKDSVMLMNVPAISQMRRDPAYARVICSATCAAMAMNGLGADLLPEEVTLSNYDYGFGGNGNWSFTCAAMGAYGFESYVSYASFDGLRQELSKGNAVCLSVKYSNKKDDPSLPYLENAPCRTNGHLICVVGYEYRDSLAERVYYALDPAAKSDKEVGPLAYRESQLDKAWYRRASYIVHSPDSVREDRSAAYRVTARLEPDKDHYVLKSDKGSFAVKPDFTQDPFEPFGFHGTICWYVPSEGGKRNDGRKMCTANEFFHYDGFSIDINGYLHPEDPCLLRSIEDDRDIRFVFIRNDGIAVFADLMPRSVPETVRETE